MSSEDKNTRKSDHPRQTDHLRETDQPSRPDQPKPSNQEKEANRLIHETSPYLQQHARNPVDWYPWGEEALERARTENRMIFLSIGYSSCHWCHVMERESFENPHIARLLNKHFVNIKVDREERPDVDAVYMEALQMMTGQGGWPLNIWLTPEQIPVFAGTYFPPQDAHGRPGFASVITRLAEIYRSHPDKIEEQTVEMRKALSNDIYDHLGSGSVTPELLDRAYQGYADMFDEEDGGFSAAPKFPAAMSIGFLLRYSHRPGSPQALHMSLFSLEKMISGGIYDQIGGGFHRYSTDGKWLVPHFEKMLYDQALVAIAALEAYRASGDEEMADFARKIISYVLSEMRSPQGAFYAAEDADSEGHEGTFYIWRLEELKEILGKERGELIAAYFGVTGKGNFENGTSILHRSKNDDEFAAERGICQSELQQAVEESRKLLFEARSRRERPFRDDKILTSWNGLMIAALAAGSRILEDPEYLEAAENALSFINGNMVKPDGRLLRRYRDGEAAISAFLDDYAYLAWGCLELYRAGSNQKHLEEAERLVRLLLDEFLADSGYLHFSAGNEEPADFGLEAEAYDGAMPSGWSAAVFSLLQLGQMLPDEDLAGEAEKLIKLQQDKLERYPTGFSYLLTALDYTLHVSEESLYCSQDGDCGWE